MMRTVMAPNAAPFPIEETTIAALHAAYVSGRSTAVSVCQAHLDRIAALDARPEIAWTSTFQKPAFEGAVRKAKE
jgi:Asp-tRNA(Asn)/Glu-tRNA(Gln) amidotransferase A subunit family amidase